MKKLDERLGFGFGISLVLIFVLFCTLLTTFTKPIPKTYLINFYSDNELVVTEKLVEGTTISEERLEEIAKVCLDGSEVFKYDWSHNPETFRKVNFSLISTNTDVYLFKYLDEFEINVIENETFTYEIISDGPIVNGSNVEIKINQNVSSKQYHMSVFANNMLIDINDNGNYLVENISDDVEIRVEYLEILYLEFIKEDKYIYDSSPHKLDYIVKDFENNIVDISDILIRYYNSSGGLIDEVVDAGTYKVKLEYLADEYYVEPIETTLIVDKAKPYLDVDDKFIYYDGSPHGFNVLDIETNSDGLIEFTNNEHTDVGSYVVDISIKESKNYYGVETKAYLNILQAKTNISENPIADVGFEGHTLDDVGFVEGVANTDGIFEWKDPHQVLDVGVYEYAMVFIPNDPSYEQVELMVRVETISYIEQLQRIKTDRERVENDTSILQGNKLSVKTELGTDIMWMSLSSALMVDSGGNITIIGSPGTYAVEIIGIMMYGDTAEYVTITLNVVIDTGGGIQLTRL